MARAGCSGISAARVSPRLAASSASSASTTSVMEQARSTPGAASGLPSLPSDDPQVGQSFRIWSGATVAAHYGFLQTWPRRASISSAAAGPQVPAA